MTDSAAQLDLHRRTTFFDVTPQDYENLPRISKAVSRSADKTLDQFYSKIRNTPETARLFASPQAFEHAKQKLGAHWLNLYSTRVDAGYVAKAEQIGKIHAQIGLEPTWYIGGYATLISGALRNLAGSSGFVSAKSFGAIASTLVKLAMLDMEIALSAYTKAEEEKRQAVIDKLGEALSRAAKGDFTQPLSDLPPSYRKIEEDYERMRREVHETLQSVANGASTINTGAAEIRQASDDLSSRTERQAASLEETAAAMEQLTVGVREAADGAIGMTHAIGETNADAHAGIDVAAEAVSAMDGIQRSASEISKIIEVIDGIAFQTNLLALNAGVEAARAGDAGRGFAVVATEVRALAQRSAEAANSIKTLINASSEQVAKGVTLVGQSGDAFAAIASKIEDINRLAGNISELSQTQAANLQHVNGAVRDMDQMTQHNAAMVEQSNAAARSLAHEAEHLAELVSRFDVGKSAAAGSYRSPRVAPALARTPTRIAGPPSGSLPAPRPSGVNAAPPAAPRLTAAPRQSNTALAEDWSEF